MSGLVYDAGALVAADRNNRRMWAMHRRALERGIVPRVPATVVIQAWRSPRQAHLARLLNGSDIVEVGEWRARRAGQLLAQSRSDDAVDASVVELATDGESAVVTSDRQDIEDIAHSNGIRLSIHDI
jgi:hypothetical protein